MKLCVASPFSRLARTPLPMTTPCLRLVAARRQVGADFRRLAPKLRRGLIFARLADPRRSPEARVELAELGLPRRLQGGFLVFGLALLIGLKLLLELEDALQDGIR